MLRVALVFATVLLRSAEAFAPRSLHTSAATAAVSRTARAAAGSPHRRSAGSTLRAVAPGSTPPPTFEVLDERPAYDGWRRIVHRDVKMPSGNIATFDIMKQDDPSVLVFTWFTDTKTTTLIRELAPGKMVFGTSIVAGICEPKKHESVLEAAKFELEEEAHLTSGPATRWVPLLRRAVAGGGGGEEEATVAADKYSTAHSHVYLVIDPVRAPSPRPLDAEEFIEIEGGVGIAEVTRRVLSGEMNVTSSYTCLLALHRLREMGLLEQ